MEEKRNYILHMKEFRAPLIEEQIAGWEEVAQLHLQEIDELVDMDFIEVGDVYGFEQFISDEPTVWEEMNDKDRMIAVKGIGLAMGIDFDNISGHQLIGLYREKGIKDQNTEGEVRVTVLRSISDRWNVRKMEYENPKAGTRYDLIRAE